MRFGLYAFDDFWKDQVEAERKSMEKWHWTPCAGVQSLKHGNIQHAQTPSYRWNMKWSQTTLGGGNSIFFLNFHPELWVYSLEAGNKFRHTMAKTFDM